VNRARAAGRWRAPLLAALFAIAIRAPVLNAGYGWDSDAWRMAAAAQAIAESGAYVASRAPGYPLTELGDAALARLGAWGTRPWATNGLRALEAGLAAAALAWLARRLRLSSPLLLACAFTSTPAIFVAGTSTLDAMGSLALGTLALGLAHSRRPWPAGAAVGLAAGLRPPGLVFVLPVLAMLLARARPRDAAKAAIVALVVAALGYAPALLAGGADAVGYYDLGYPAALLVVKKATLDLWGPLGLLGIGAAVAWSIVRGSRAEGDPSAVPALVLGFVAFGVLYLRLPYKALYLAPLVPFALLLLARWARPGALRVALALLVVSPWIGALHEPGKFDDPAPARWATTIHTARGPVRLEARGAVWMDRLRREAGMAYGRRVLASARALPEPALVVAGDLLPMLRVLTGAVAGPADAGNVRFVHHLTAADVEFARAGRRAIWLVPGAEGSPSARFGVDPAASGARPLPLAPRP
jgi:hypothetical protein